MLAELRALMNAIEVETGRKVRELSLGADILRAVRRELGPRAVILMRDPDWEQMMGGQLDGLTLMATHPLASGNVTMRCDLAKPEAIKKEQP